MKWGITKTVLSVDIGTFLNQQVADVVASELSGDREQGVAVGVSDISTEHVAFDIGFDNLYLVELNCMEDLVAFSLFDTSLEDFLFP